MWTSLKSLTDFWCGLFRIGLPGEDARKMTLTWAYEPGNRSNEVLVQRGEEGMDPGVV